MPAVTSPQLKRSKVVVLLAAAMSSALIASGSIILKEGSLNFSTRLNSDPVPERITPSTCASKPDPSSEQPEWPTALSNSTASIIIEILRASHLNVQEEIDVALRPTVMPEPEYDQTVALSPEELKRASRRRSKGYKARQSRLVRDFTRKQRQERELAKRRRVRPSRCTNAELVWPPSIAPSPSPATTPSCACINGVLASCCAVKIPSDCEELDLFDQNLSDVHAHSLASALRTSKLRWLDLTKNNLGPEAGISLGCALPLASLQYLNLNSNSLGPSGAEALSKGLGQHQNSLETLVLHNNFIGDAGAVALADALEQPSTQLKRLMLINNGIGDDGAAALARALLLKQHLPVSTSQTSTRMHRGRNRPRNTPCEWFSSDSNREVIGLQILNLNSNVIGDKGAVALGKALEHSLSLDQLYLSDQRCHSANSWKCSAPLGDVGALALASGLEANPRLSTLFLTGNSIGQDGAGALIECLETTALSILGLEHNTGGITESQYRRIQQLTTF